MSAIVLHDFIRGTPEDSGALLELPCPVCQEVFRVSVTEDFRFSFQHCIGSTYSGTINAKPEHHAMMQEMLRKGKS